MKKTLLERVCPSPRTKVRKEGQQLYLEKFYLVY